MDYGEFKEIIVQKGADLYRDMPWRQDTRPYYILVSELMLQQTQVDRVIPKFQAFIATFPNEIVLAAASLADVLVLWQGLGYNRRAKYLHDAAKKIVEAGEFPQSEPDLLALPGVGQNTAGALQVYAYNQPAIFVETNIRTVYFHHFFAHGNPVEDSEIRNLLAVTIDREHPREFYWALMDYGSWLKRNGAGRITQSKHYVKQSALAGSVREVRGKIVAYLVAHGDTEKSALRVAMPQDERFLVAYIGLQKDGIIDESNQVAHLTK